MKLSELNKNKKLKERLLKRFLSKLDKKVNSKGCWQVFAYDSDNRYIKRMNYWNKEDQRSRAINIKALSYEYFRKEKIPENLNIICKCGNIFCVNPDHHFVGNTGDQLRFLESKGWKRRTGHKLSPERIAQISKLHKGKVVSKETREKIRQSLLNSNYTHSEATRKKMSKTRTGVKMPEGTGEKVAFTKQGEKNYNTRLTKEDILKIRSLSGKETQATLSEIYGVSQGHINNIINRKVWKHI